VLLLRVDKASVRASKERPPETPKAAKQKQEEQ
jgi:hypothetical protein